MADSFELDFDQGYQSTNMYKQASPDRRRQMNRYKKELGISDKHMFLLLFQQDLEGVPESERTNGDTMANAMLVFGFLLLWGTLQSAMNAPGGTNITMIFIGLASFGLVCFVYFKGILNPYKRAVREVKKLMKEYPEVQDFDSWEAEHPSREDRKASKKKRR